MSNNFGFIELQWADWKWVGPFSVEKNEVTNSSICHKIPDHGQDIGSKYGTNLGGF
jgi:hypothetical protein